MTGSRRAARGARYAFPGWPTETTQKNGKVKVEYLDKTAAGTKAREFLAGAESLSEIAGRLFCLIAAARYADERAVARSNRSMSSLTVRSGLPYSAQAIDLIDDVCADRLPDHLTHAVRQDRAEQREAAAERDRIVSAARERLEAAVARAADLSADEREQTLADVEVVHGRYSVEGHKLRKQLEPGEAPAADDDSAAHAA